MEKKMKLDFVVIGSQKCATTWIYDCLKDHPQLNLRDSKNEDAYYGGPLYQERGGDEWYFSQFKNGDSNKLKGCVSVEYIEDKSIPEVLYKLNPAIKLIASFRNPSDRAVSAYQWYVRKAFIPNLPLEEGMRQVIKHYKNEISDSYSPMYRNIIERGFYYDRLKRFLQIFPAKQLKISLFDDVKENPLNAFQSLLSFLEVDNSFIAPNINTVPKKNTGFSPLIKLQRIFPTSRIVGKMVDVSNQVLFKTTKQKAVSESLDKSIIENLRAIYRPSLEELHKQIVGIEPMAARTIEKKWLNY